MIVRIPRTVVVHTIQMAIPKRDHRVEVIIGVHYAHLVSLLSLYLFLIKIIDLFLLRLPFLKMIALPSYIFIDCDIIELPFCIENFNL